MSGPSCLGGTGPCPVRSLKLSALYGRRLIRKNRGSWSAIGHALPPDHRRTEQVGRHQAACNRNISLQILMAKGPSGPRIGRKQILILPAGVYQKPEVARSRKNGVQGATPMNTGASRVFIEGSPLAHLWLLSVRAESNTRPPEKQKTYPHFYQSLWTKNRNLSRSTSAKVPVFSSLMKQKVRRKHRFQAPAVPMHPAAARALRCGTG